MTCQIKFIENSKIIEAVLDKITQTFVTYIDSLAAKIRIYLGRKVRYL